MEPFFTDLFRLIDGNIVGIASEKSRAVSALIAPAVYTCMSIILLFQGYRQMFGMVEQPLQEFLHSTFKMVGVSFVALNAGEYNDLLISTFQDSPSMLMAALSNTPNATAATLSSNVGNTLDQTINHAISAGMSFWTQTSLATPGGFIIAPLVWLIGLVCTLYMAFLVILSKLAVGMVLALGPLAIFGLLFNATKNFFSSFITTLIQYSLVGALAVLSNETIISIFQRAAAAAAARGNELQIVDLFAMFITGGISVMLLKQVEGIAASLSGGVSLSTFGISGMMQRATTDANKYAAGKSYNINRRLLGKLASSAQTKNEITPTKNEKLVPRPERRRTGTTGN